MVAIAQCLQGLTLWQPKIQVAIVAITQSLTVFVITTPIRRYKNIEPLRHRFSFF